MNCIFSILYLFSLAHHVACRVPMCNMFRMWIGKFALTYHFYIVKSFPLHFVESSWIMNLSRMLKVLADELHLFYIVFVFPLHIMLLADFLYVICLECELDNLPQLITSTLLKVSHYILLKVVVTFVLQIVISLHLIVVCWILDQELGSKLRESVSLKRQLDDVPIAEEIVQYVLLLLIPFLLNPFKHPLERRKYNILWPNRIRSILHLKHKSTTPPSVNPNLARHRLCGRSSCWCSQPWLLRDWPWLNLETEIYFFW